MRKPFPPLLIEFLDERTDRIASFEILPSVSPASEDAEFCPHCEALLVEPIVKGRLRFAVGDTIYRADWLDCRECNQPVYRRPALKLGHPFPPFTSELLDAMPPLEAGE